MRTTILPIAFFFSIYLFLFLFSACGGSSISQADENGTDSLATQNTTNDVKKISFEVVSDSGQVKFYPNENESPSATFKYQLLIVTGVPKESNLEAIQAILQQKQEYSGDAKQALAKKKQEYFDSYMSVYKEEGMEGHVTNWDSDTYTEVMYNDNYFTTIAIMMDEYSGGAHPNSYVSYFVLDLKQNKQITLDNIFDANGLATIKQKILDKSLEIAKQEGATTLEEAGFFVEALKPTENFIVSDTGIEFVYNRSEITPYAMPSPSYSFSWAELKSNMKADSPLHVLVK